MVFKHSVEFSVQDCVSSRYNVLDLTKHYIEEKEGYLDLLLKNADDFGNCWAKSYVSILGDRVSSKEETP